MQINVGHRDYGYKSALPQLPAIEVNTIKDVANWKKYIGPALAVGVTLLLQIDPGVTLAMAPGIDVQPIKEFSNSIYWTMVEVAAYLSLPVFGWIGYVFAFAGNNSGKRSAAKITFFSLAGGLLFLIAAPWVGGEIIKLGKAVFQK